jgi:hypothetical protein
MLVVVVVIVPIAHDSFDQEANAPLQKFYHRPKNLRFEFPSSSVFGGMLTKCKK